jgi:hypothetical protein
MGQDLIENGLSPRVDHYSFTFKGEPISHAPYLFQFFLYYLVDGFGLENGFVLYKTIGITALLITALIWLWQIRAPVGLIAVYLVMLIALIQLRTMVRPDLLSNSLIILVLILMYRAKNEYSARTMLPVVVLMVFWSNYHTPILGYVLLFGFFVDSAVVYYQNRVKKEAWVNWFAWGGIIAATGFANPNLSHAVINSINFDHRWKALIQEYVPSVFYASKPIVYVLVAVAILLIALLVRKRRVGLLIVVVILSYNSLLLSRMVAVTGIIFISLFTMLVSELDYTAWIGRQTPKIRHSISIILVSVAGILILDIATVARAYDRSRDSAMAKYPYEVVDYIKSNNLNGRIINEYGSGGFLLYHLAPDSEIYIDGRTNILYPIEHLIQYRKIRVDPKLFRQEVARYDVGYAILDTNSEAYELVHSAGILNLEFAGRRFSLFSEKGGGFETLQLLAARPACWKSISHAEFNREYSLAKRTFPEKFGLMPFLRLVNAYSEAEDPISFLESLESIGRLPAWSLRFAGYQSLELNQYDMAFKYFIALDEKNPRDFMAGSWALLQDNKHNLAESNLHTSTRVKWNNLQLSDIVAMHNLLGQLAQSGGLEKIPDSFVDNLENQLSHYQISDKDKKLHIGLFCGNIEPASM